MISFCMIVRDEEKNLPRCLESIKDIADEIIVVDTGSKDKTMDIAHEYGAKVYQHPWENDFSLHRNQAMGYATKKFVFTIDADEEFFLTDKVDKLKKFLKKLPDQYGTIMILVKDIQGNKNVMQFNSARIFRRGTVYYENAVHNQPVSTGKGGVYEGGYIQHYGYDLTPEQKEAKKERILTMLNKRLEDDPEDWDTYFYLCQCYAVNDEIDKSIDAGEIYIAHKDKVVIKDSIFFTMVRQYMRKENEAKASEWLHMGLERMPEDIDLNVAMVEFGIWANNGFLVAKGATQYIMSHEAMKQNPLIKGNRFIFSFNNEVLAFCHYWLALVRLEEGKRVLDALKNLLPQTTAECQAKTWSNLHELGERLGGFSFGTPS